MSLNLNVPPKKDSDRFDDWIYRLWKAIRDGTESTSSTTPSSGTTDHTQLSNLNSGNYSHLSSDQLSQLTSGKITSLHQHNQGNIDHAALSNLNSYSYYHLNQQEYTGTGYGIFVKQSYPNILGQTVDYIDFDQDETVTDQTGRLTWNSADGTLNLGMGYDGVTQQIGLEQFYHVKNQTGSTLSNGYAARSVGTIGNSGQLKAGYAIADGSIDAKYNLGILTMEIANGADGYVTSFGLVRNINTTGATFGETWSDGDLLYVSAVTPGHLTNVEPVAPNQKLLLAIVINAHSSGSIFVRPTFYGTLNDLQGVYVPTPVNKGYLVYDVDNLRWEQRTNTMGNGLSQADNGTTVTTTLVSFVGDSGSGGIIGAVPAPSSGDGSADTRKYLSADGLWRILDIPAHNELTGVSGGINSGVFETTAFESTAFQQGIVQFYHLTLPDYESIVNQQAILSVAVDTTLNDDAYTVLVTASAKTITLPAASAARLGRTWTIVQNCNGYVDISPNTDDLIILQGGSDTIRITQIGSNITLRCVSVTQWVII